MGAILNIAFLTISLDRCLALHILAKTTLMLAVSCHKRVRGTGKWIKKELLEMEEGRSKEEAKQLLQVRYVQYVQYVWFMKKALVVEIQFA